MSFLKFSETDARYYIIIIIVVFVLGRMGETQPRRTIGNVGDNYTAQGNRQYSS